MMDIRDWVDIVQDMKHHSVDHGEASLMPMIEYHRNGQVLARCTTPTEDADAFIVVAGRMFFADRVYLAIDSWMLDAARVQPGLRPSEHAEAESAIICYEVDQDGSMERIALRYAVEDDGSISWGPEEPASGSAIIQDRFGNAATEALVDLGLWAVQQEVANELGIDDAEAQGRYFSVAIQTLAPMFPGSLVELCLPSEVMRWTQRSLDAQRERSEAEWN